MACCFVVFFVVALEKRIWATSHHHGCVGGCGCGMLVALWLCAVCKIMQNFKLLIFPFTCVFILLCMGIFPLKQMNLLINDVTFHSAVISQITAAGPPFCDLSNFMCLHSRCLFTVCFWTIIGWGCFYTFYYYCTFLQILSGLFSFQFFLNKGLYCDICLHCKLLKSIIFEEH